MSTRKLYDDDPYLLRATCRIGACEPVEGGFAVVPDQTVFFARGGGQLCDRGTLGGASVRDTYEREDGGIVHLLDRPVPAGEHVMELEWDTRRDHMEQHLGQHILSAAFEELYGVHSVIARLEDGRCHVELSDELDEQALVRVQDRANEIVAQDRAVTCRFVAPEELRTLAVRGRISPHEHVRVVEIADYDRNGCGGTHCRSTGEVGEILLCGAKRVRGVFRVYFVCGERAQREAHGRTAPLLALQRAFGCDGLDELCGQAPAVLARRDALEEQVHALRARLLEGDAALFCALAQPGRDGLRVLCRVVEGGDVKHLREVCDRLTAHERGLVLLLAAAGEGQTALLFARSKGEGPDLGQALRALTAACGGRGGGNAVLAQGMIPGDGWREAFAALPQTLGLV